MADLLDTLGAHVRERECPEPWRDVAEGRLTPDEAARHPDVQEEPDERIRAAQRLFAPPSADARATVLDAVLRSAEPSGGESSDAPPDAKITPISAAKRWRWIAPMAAAAAAVLIIVAFPNSRDGEATGGQAVERPEPLGVQYELELSGGFSPERGRAKPVVMPVLLSPDAPIQLVARPEVALPDGAQPELAVFAIGPGGTRRIEVEAERTAEGVLRVRGTTGDVLGLPAGDWTIAVVVGPAGAIPQTLPDESSETIQRMDTRIRVQGRPGL